MSILSHKLRPRASGKARKRRRTELSEMVTHRARDATAFVSSIRVHRAEVAAALRERFTPALRAGEAVPDHELTLELAGRSVELAFDRLDDLDERHRRVRAEHAHLSREVDCVAKQELYPVAVDVRRQIDGALGREAGSKLHSFTGRTPRATVRLEAHVERAVSRLGNPHRLPPRHQAGEPVDREGLPEERAAGWKRRLEAPLRKLTAAGEQLDRLTAELNAVSGKRQQAMERFDAIHAEALHLAEAAYRMAGIGEKMVRSLRSGVERRRLARWARRKREARAGGRSAGAGDSADSRPSAAARRPAAGAVTVVSRWLGKMWGFR